MKKHEYVLFNNYDFSENYDYAREWLFTTRQDDFEWETPNDIPETMILDEMSFMESSEWSYFQSKYEELLSAGDCILTGVCGRWNGPARGGKFIRTFSDLMSCIGHLDYLKIIDRNGHLIIEGHHHDGADVYVIKQLTRRGEAFARLYNYARDEHLHSTIMKYNFYSKLPKLAYL